MFIGNIIVLTIHAKGDFYERFSRLAAAFYAGALRYRQAEYDAAVDRCCSVYSFDIYAVSCCATGADNTFVCFDVCGGFPRYVAQYLQALSGEQAVFGVFGQTQRPRSQIFPLSALQTKGACAA